MIVLSFFENYSYADVPVNNEDINDPTHQFRHEKYQNTEQRSLDRRSLDGLTRQECAQYMVQHKADSSVRYEGGVDVEGNAVVSADLYPRPSYGTDGNMTFEGDGSLYLSNHHGGHPGHNGHHHGGNHHHNHNHHHNGHHGHHHHRHRYPGYPYGGYGSVTVTPEGDTYMNGDYVGDKERRDIENNCRQAFPGL